MRKTIAYARKMRSQPRQAKSPPHCAAGSTESKVSTTTATPTPEALAIAVIFKDFAIDHTPDGWPAVKQMHLNAAAAELERQHAEIDRLTDAYCGAREDLAIWKRRALVAEEKLRAESAASSRLVSELNAQNGPTHMGEPARQRKPLSVDRIKELSVGMAFESVAFARAIESAHGIGEKP